MGSAKKGSSPPPPSPSPVVELFRWMRGPGRFVSILAVIFGVFFGGWYLVWRAVAPGVVNADAYRLARESIEATPLPPWIRGVNLRDEVFRDLNGSLSILDEGLVERIRKAFSLQPWVARVESVRVFHPARVKVELVYRRPVCMVQVGDDFVPVDVEGVVLPSGGFSPAEKQSYPMLVGLNAGPLNQLVGTRWGDPRVVGAAQIATMLLPVWERYGLRKIVVSQGPDALQPQDITYEFLTVRGVKPTLFWGHAPGLEAVSEASAERKAAEIKRIFTERQTLEQSKDLPPIDLTQAPPLP